MKKIILALSILTTIPAMAAQEDPTYDKVGPDTYVVEDFYENKIFELTCGPKPTFSVNGFEAKYVELTNDITHAYKYDYYPSESIESAKEFYSMIKNAKPGDVLYVSDASSTSHMAFYALDHQKVLPSLESCFK